MQTEAVAFKEGGTTSVGPEGSGGSRVSRFLSMLIPYQVSRSHSFPTNFGVSRFVGVENFTFLGALLFL